MVDQRLLEQVDGLGLSPRAAALREQFFNSEAGVASEHVLSAMRSWQETEGEPLDIRRAKLLLRVCQEVPTTIFRGQKILGSNTKYFRGAYPHPEYDGKYLLALLEEDQTKMTLGGPVEKGVMTGEDYAVLKEAAEYWRGRTAIDHIQKTTREVMGTWYDDLCEAGSNRYETILAGPFGIDWARLISDGMGGVRKQAQEQMDRWLERRESDVEQMHFWRAVTIVCDATITLAHRYAQKARELAAAEQDPVIKAELLKSAETLDWVPENPPRTFREGLQSLVLVHLALALESTCMPPTSIGRVDRDLYPVFKRDIDEGRMTVAEAGDLLADFIQYIARQEWVMELSWRDYMQKGVLCSIGLGGTDAEGNDIANELTALLLHTMGLSRYAEPHMAIGWHKNIPDWLVRKALETNWKVGGGVPQFQNIDHFIDLCGRHGVSEADARNWTSHGCSQLEPYGQVSSMEPTYINVPLSIDLALHNGVVSKTGKRLGPETGDPRSFKTFDDFYAAFKTQAENVIRKQIWHDDMVDRMRPNYYRQPLASALLPGCIEKGRDFADGGLTHYAMCYKKDRGLIPTADSLTAVKKLVFDQGKLSMAELLDAIDNDFAGPRGEDIRQMCLAAPKYGNDDDETDLMVRDVAMFTGGVILSTNNIWGYQNAINRNGQSWHYMAGKRLAALPTGRKAGMPLADGSLSPMQGMDRKGPTALLNSALKADFRQQALGGILTVKFPAPLFQSSELRDKIAALTGGFFDDGGTYIQYNVLDSNMLREAKKHPERYRDLVVRVGGYSAYFVNLSADIQDEIIARTEHSLVAV